ncbi:MAG: ATP-binding protein [Bacteroidota bacterium]
MKQKIYFILTLIFCFFISENKVHAQTYQHLDFLSIKDGMPNMNIMHAFVCSNGYLWIVTKVGLVRYDGRNIVEVQVDIPASDFEFITQIVEFPKDHLLFLKNTFKTGFPSLLPTSFIEQAYCYNITSNKSCFFRELQDHFSIDLQKSTLLYQNEAETGLFIVQEGREVYHLKEQETKLLYRALPQDTITFLHLDNDNSLWIGSQKNLYKYNLETKENEVIRSIYNSFDYSNLYDVEGKLLPDSLFWGIVSKHKMRQAINTTLQTKGRPIISINKQQNEVIATHVDSLFFFTEEGLAQSLQLVASTHQIVYADDSKLILQGEVLEFLDRKSLPLKAIAHSEQISVRGIQLLNKDSLLLNTYSGQFIHPRTSNHLTLKNRVSSYNYGYGMSITEEGVVWSGGHHYGVNRQEINNIDNYSRYFIKTRNDQFLHPNYIHYDASNQSLFAGSSQGLFLQDTDLDSFLLIERGLFAEQLMTANILGIRQIGDTIWIGSNKGLFVYTNEKGVFDNYQFEYDIIDICMESSNVFWLATHSNGVLRWRINDNTITRFTTEQGLSHNTPTCIYTDFVGNLWIPTFKGLNYLDTKDFTIQTFYKKDGLPENEYNFSSHLLTLDSFLYLGGIAGITEIDLRYTTENNPFGKSDLPLVQNAYTIYNDQNEINTFTDFSEGIVLNHGDTYFDLDFSIVDFSGEPTFDFAYRIEGLHEDWIYKNDGKLQLSKPKFGQYNLQIRAKGVDGRWSKNELSIPIISNKPFFLSTWFLSIALLSLGALIYLIVKWRSRYLERENLKLEQEVANRTLTINQQLTELQQLQAQKQKIYSIIGHDLRSPILGMLNFSKKINFLIQRNRTEQLKDLAIQFDHNLKGISGLLNNLLDWSRLEEKRYFLEPAKIDFTTVIKENIALYQSYLAQKALSMECHIADEIAIEADRRAISTTIRNLLDNAIKYAPEASRIDVALEVEKDSCLFSISNKGVLADAIVEYLNTINTSVKLATGLTEGLGLGICKELVHLNGGQLKVEHTEEGRVLFLVRFDCV